MNVDHEYLVATFNEELERALREAAMNQRPLDINRWTRDNCGPF